MYCPQCATENLDNASFCRGCGSNISLVPQALTGNLPAATEEDYDDEDTRRRRRKRQGKGQPSIEKGIKNIFMGLAFIIVASAARKYMPGAGTWFFWFYIPAFVMLGGGIAELVRCKTEKNTRLPAAPQPVAMPSMPPRPGALPRRNTAELVQQPPSVTEGTTRHLDAPVKSRPKDV